MNKADEIGQVEKRRVLENDRQVMSTYLSHANASIDDEAQGRYGFIRGAAESHWDIAD